MEGTPQIFLCEWIKLPPPPASGVYGHLMGYNVLGHMLEYGYVQSVMGAYSEWVIDLLPLFLVKGEKIKSRELEGKILGNITWPFSGRTKHSTQVSCIRVWQLPSTSCWLSHSSHCCALQASVAIPWGFCGSADVDWLGPGWGLKVCIFCEHLGDADAGQAIIWLIKLQNTILIF